MSILSYLNPFSWFRKETSSDDDDLVIIESEEEFSSDSQVDKESFPPDHIENNSPSVLENVVPQRIQRESNGPLSDRYLRLHPRDKNNSYRGYGSRRNRCKYHLNHSNRVGWH